MAAVPAAPRVSVVMPVYNGAEHLADTLEALLGQTFGDFEVVAVDDGSSDGSWELLQSYAARDPRIRIERHAHNRGHRAASNRSFALARGAYVARNDQDDPSRPRRLELQAEYLDRHPAVGVVAGAYRRRFADGRCSVATPPTEHALIRWALLFDMVFCHSSLMFRRELVSGPSPYRFAPAAYDYEVCARLARTTRLAALGEPLVDYRIHQTGLSTTGNRAMRNSAAAISARQLRRLLAPRRLTREEIGALRHLALGRDVAAADLELLPLLFAVLARLGEEPGVTSDDLVRIEQSALSRLTRSVPLHNLGPLLRHDPAAVGRSVWHRLTRGGRRFGDRMLGPR